MNKLQKLYLNIFLSLCIFNKAKRNQFKKLLSSYGKNNKIVLISNGKKSENSYCLVLIPII